MELRVDFTRTNGTKAFAYYEKFYVAGPKDKYRLTIEGFNPNVSTVTDALSVNNGAQFSTYDQDNDGLSFINCCTHLYVGAWGGGWWFGSGARLIGTRDCFHGMFTTRYFNDLTQKKQYGIIWRNGGFRQFGPQPIVFEDFNHAEMKIRPKAWHCGNMYWKKALHGNVPL